MVSRRRVLSLAGAATAAAALSGAVRAEGGLLPAKLELPFAVETPLRVGSVELGVRNLARSRWFYERVMGFDVIEQEPKRLALGVAGKVLVVLHHEADANPQRASEAGLYHTAFLMPSRTELARWLVHAAAMGVQFSGFADHRVSEALYLDDPDGNGVEVYADRPQDEWTWEGDRVVMGSLPIDLDGLLALVPNDRDTFSFAPATTRVGHVHLRAGDVQDAEAFYATILGLDVVSGREDAIFLSSGRYHHHVALNTWESAGAGMRSPRDAGLRKLVLESEGSAWIENVRGRALDTTSIEGGIALTDPWGTAVEIRSA